MAEDVGVGASDTSLSRMRLISPEEVEAVVAMRTTPDPYDSLTAEQKIQLVAYRLTPDQRTVLNELSIEGKLNFLDRYWLEQDDRPATQYNELRVAVITRYRYANQNFSTNESKNDGWSTDRGRIFIKYGPWDEIEDRQTPRLSNAYQIWYYRGVDEGLVFVFEDWMGHFSDFRLVHSNVEGEIRSDAWEDLLRQGFPDIGED